MATEDIKGDLLKIAVDTYHSDELGEVTIPDNEAGEADFQQVVDHLKTDAGITDATVESTGGGIDVIKVPCGRWSLYFGTAAEVWGASVYEKTDGQFPDDEEITDDQVWTDVSSDEADPSAVALAITMAAMQFDRSHKQPKQSSKQAAAMWMASMPLGSDDYIVVGSSRQQCEEALWAFFEKAKAQGWYKHEDYTNITNLKELDEYLGVKITPVRPGAVIGPGDWTNISHA
jgi:hypothetical protein